jgi:hypothetical protein
VKRIFIGLAVTSSILACGTSDPAKQSTENQAYSIQSVESEPMSAINQKLFADIEATLQNPTQLNSAGVSNLGNADIANILGNGKLALFQNGLLGSSDLSAILPILMSGSAKGIGGLGFLDGSQKTDLFALIGGGALPSLIGGNLTGGNAGEILSSSLFQNLPNLGLGAGALPTQSGSLMESLMAQFGGSSLGGVLGGGMMLPPGSDIADWMKGISLGAVSGVGGINLPGFGSGQLQDALRLISAGGVNGIINMPGMNPINFMGLNIPNGNLTQLLEQFTKGSTLGVGGLPFNPQGLIGGNFAGGTLDMNTIFQQIGMGSVLGTTGSPFSNGMSLQLILGSFVNGSQSGLPAIPNLGGKSGGLNIEQLLAGMIGGQMSGVGGLPIGTANQNEGINFLMQLLAGLGQR